MVEKWPRISLDLKFRELGGERFDVAVSNSVFPQPPEDVPEIFEHIGDILDVGAGYYTTFKPKRMDDSLVMSSFLPTTFYYTFDELASITADASLEIERETPTATPTRTWSACGFPWTPHSIL